MGCTGRWLVAVGLTIALAGTAVAQPGQDPLAGSRVFGAKGCARCHAVNGVGSKIGPDLGRIARPRSFYDLAAAMWSHLPRMAQRMREMGIARPRLEAREAADLVGFLYTVGYFDAPGNAEGGRRLFSEKRCITCHSVGGVGGVIGPSLDFARQLASPILVAASLWNHGPQMAEAMKARGIARPALTARELRDIIAYLAPATAGPEDAPVYALPGRPELGRVLFAEKRCIECHAVGGAGGRVGPDLVTRGVRWSPLEFAATLWNKAPAMMAAMAARGISVPQLRPEEMADLVAYLYSVRYFAEPGDIRRGFAVLAQKGCLDCHAAGGETGKPASDLSQVRGLDSPAAVLAALWNHTAVPQPGTGKWPELRAEEMADLVAALGSTSGRAR